jgi:hypothetical protein
MFKMACMLPLLISEGFLAWRASMSDEQWVEWGAISDEQWVEYVRQNFHLNVSL